MLLLIFFSLFNVVQIAIQFGKSKQNEIFDETGSMGHSSIKIFTSSRFKYW